MGQNIHQKTLEKHFINAFVGTVIDFNNGIIELEEDCRASNYHQLRKTVIDNIKSLQIFLSHNLSFIKTTKKPDISIVRTGKYFLCAEFKISTNHDGKIGDLNVKSAKEDILRLKEFKDGFPCGYAVRIQKNEHIVIDYTNIEEWMPGYLRELYYIISKKEICFFSVKEVIVRNKTVLKGGLIKIKLKDVLEAQKSGRLLSTLFEEKYKNKYKIDMLK